MQHISVAGRLGAVSVVILLVTLVAGCYSSPLEEARKQVSVGTLRDDAIRILSEKAWYHQPCPNRITIDDLFFFGSHKYDKAEVVIVTSEPIAGVFVVYDLGSFEPYAWHAAYQDCLQRKQFED
ncbi:hypothetical protein [Candidatus Amarolinea dominans]|uniref:hypothetical protein n=1 Tax=Candidatus Amarolinea dominans TaxID=3140696 RepID=UPI003134BA8F|nr:hypothetical protein [Anaerolineae bacterium]